MTISRDDIEAKANQLIDAVEGTAKSAKKIGIWGVLGAAAVVAGAFYLGRRRATRNKTVVEVYRV